MSTDEQDQTWRDPKALALWVMTALVMWLAIIASHRVGRIIWEATTPADQRVLEPGSAPGHLWFGIAATLITLAAVIGICLWLRLGVLWLLFTVVLASFMYLLIAIFPPPWGTLLFLIVPPITGALFLKPKARLEQ